MVWDEHASNMIPLVKRLDYYGKTCKECWNEEVSDV